VPGRPIGPCDPVAPVAPVSPIGPCGPCGPVGPITRDPVPSCPVAVSTTTGSALESPVRLLELMPAKYANVCVPKVPIRMVDDSDVPAFPI
jgi:hypothetical protein